MGHTLLKELLTKKLTKDMRITRHAFLASFGVAMYEYLEHTHGRVEAQVSQSQLLTYLQEAVSLDRDLNQLRLDQMLRMSQGKTLMVLTQCMDALDNIAALADEASPRTGSSGGWDPGNQHKVNWSEFGCESEDDGNGNDSSTDDGFTEDEVI
jgi:hypothetical protein